MNNVQKYFAESLLSARKINGIYDGTYGPNGEAIIKITSMYAEWAAVAIRIAANSMLNDTTIPESAKQPNLVNNTLAKIDEAANSSTDNGYLSPDNSFAFSYNIQKLAIHIDAVNGNDTVLGIWWDCFKSAAADWVTRFGTLANLPETTSNGINALVKTADDVAKAAKEALIKAKDQVDKVQKKLEYVPWIIGGSCLLFIGTILFVKRKK